MGGGQLARMTVEAASALAIPTVVLAEHPDDAAALVAAQVVVGSPLVPGDLGALAERVDVITFDHEQVDLELCAVAAAGTSGATGPTHPRDGRRQGPDAPDPGRRRDPRAGLRRPGAGRRRDPPIEAFAANGWPVVLKEPGGNDGKGVWPVATPLEAAVVRDRAAAAGTTLVIEELVDLETELAVLVARRPTAGR